VDYTSADLNQSSLITLPGFNLVSRQAKVDELASARGRLGWAALPNVLLYGTGGWASAMPVVRCQRLAPSQHRPTRTRSAGWLARDWSTGCSSACCCARNTCTTDLAGSAFPACLLSSATSTSGTTSTSFAAVSATSSDPSAAVAFKAWQLAGLFFYRRRGVRAGHHVGRISMKPNSGLRRFA
jgi:hypothetical protein